MGLAGIPWWTTDIGGFHGGVNTDPSFRECLIRWFQFATFSPVLRMHGDREPHSKPLSNTGGGKCVSGAPNELWSFGEEAFAILEKYLRIRERLRPYIRSLMSAAHTKGSSNHPPDYFTTFPKMTEPGTWRMRICSDQMCSSHLSYLKDNGRGTSICRRERAGSAMGVERSSKAAKSSTNPLRSTICQSFSASTDPSDADKFKGRTANDEVAVGSRDFL